MKNVIKTKRLWLRPLEASDGEALSPAINDFEVSKWLAVVPFPYRLEDARIFIAGALNGKKIWAIIYEGRFVGVFPNILITSVTKILDRGISWASKNPNGF